LRHFLLSPQWDKLEAKYSTLEQYVYMVYGDSAMASLRRLAVIQFRVAMILTAYRKAANNMLSEVIVCDDIDFKTAGLIANVYYANFLAALKMMPHEVMHSNNQGCLVLFNELPNKIEFTASEAKEIAAKTRICSERSVDKYLKELLHKGMITQLKQYGPYIKKVKEE
jgi:hypothetical protein